MSVEEEALFLEQFREMAEQGHMLDIHEIKDAYEKKVGHRIGCAQEYRVLPPARLAKSNASKQTSEESK